MNRRDTIFTMLAMSVAPLSSEAQQRGKTWSIGVLSPSLFAQGAPYRAELIRGLQELGYTEGKDYVFEGRYAEGKNEGLPALATDLTHSNVDVILAVSTNAARAAQRATSTIPIVFVAVADPIAAGFSDSLARPSRNMTGLSNFAGDLQPKRLEILGQAIPKLSRIVALFNPSNPYSERLMSPLRSAAEGVGVRLTTVSWDAAADIDAVFAKIVREGAQAIVLGGDTYHFDQRMRISDAAIKYRMPSISPFREYTEAGALMSYGTSVKAQFRQAAAYVAKILKGAKPADLPIEQPTNFELFINLKTAKAIGLTISQTLLARADEVIQ